jgi:hypothetical protein
MTTTSSAPSTVVGRFLADVEAGHVTPSHYAPGAVLDAVVPQWRFDVTGPVAIAAEYSSWYAVPGRLEEVRRIPTAGGEVVEYTRTWVEGGIPHALRHVHVIDLDADGRIAADHVWCGGRWPAALLAEMEAARHAR